MKVKIDRFAAAISKELTDFSGDKREKMKKIIDTAAKEGAKKLKSTSPKKTGDYAKSWTNSNISENRLKKKKVIYNKAPEYRLTHLLENGHAKRGGGRVAPKVHIKPVYDEINKAIDEWVRNL